MKTYHFPIDIRVILPCTFGGGILVAIAFLLDDYTINPATFGSNLSQGAFFESLGSTARFFVLPLLAGSAARSLGGRKAWIAGIVGGMLAGQSNSGFLGAMIAGYLAGGITILLQKAFGPMPPRLEGVKTSVLYPLCGILLVGIVMQLLVNPFAAMLNTWAFNALGQIGNQSIWLGAALGAMLGADVGGPFSQAAYMFGNASLAGDQFMIMSAVMAGGMALPFCAALSALVFQKRFAKVHRQVSIANLILGLAFLPEGAIPLAAESPLRTLPAYMLAGGTAGALSMMFHCSVRAPYGGIFVLQSIGNRLGFFAAVAVGAFVGMLALGFFKNIRIYTGKNF